MEAISLSDAAQAILRRRLAAQWVEVTDETRPAYRELVEAGLMVPLHSFARGNDGAFRLTEAATAFAQSNRVPSA